MSNRVEIERRGKSVVIIDNETKCVLSPATMPKTVEEFILYALASEEEECEAIMWYVQTNEQPIYVNGQCVSWDNIKHLFNS